MFGQVVRELAAFLAALAREEAVSRIRLTG
jgi:hypothetical protein